MLSEPAVMPRTSDSVLESTCAVCPVSGPSAIPTTTPDRSYLRLVSNDVVSSSVPEATPVAATRARPTSDDIASPPLAAPPEAVASALWASPAEVLGLLTAASEHRRVVDLIWNAAQIGALQLPPPLVAAIERARASWPQALPISC